MGLPQRTPEQFLDAFEYFNREYPLDPQFTVGLPIIREWIGLRSKPTVSQADFDTLLDRFAAARGRRLRLPASRFVDTPSALGHAVRTVGAAKARPQMAQMRRRVIRMTSR